MKNLIILLIFSVGAAPAFGGVEYSLLVGLIGGGIIHQLSRQMKVTLMAAIPVQDATALFTKFLIMVFKELPQTTHFLTSFFDPIESMTREVSIMVQRGDERIAVDVYRHSDGNRNTFDRSTEKVMLPPLYDEYFTANEHRLYDQVIAALDLGNTELFAQMTEEQAEQLVKIQDKIKRAVELQAAQALTSGIVELKSGDNINYMRQANSLVDKGAGNYWATGTVDPFADMEVSCEFIRKEGLVNTGDFICIMGSEVLRDFRNNTIVKERGEIDSFKLDELIAPIRNSTGATTHGQVSAGDYNVKIMGYPQFYTDENGVKQPYLDPKSYVMVPATGSIGKESYSAVPQLLGQKPQKGRFHVTDFVDEKHTSHEIHAKSAPLIVLGKVDQVHTTQVVAT